MKHDNESQMYGAPGPGPSEPTSKVAFGGKERQVLRAHSVTLGTARWAKGDGAMRIPVAERQYRLYFYYTWHFRATD